MTEQPGTGRPHGWVAPGGSDPADQPPTPGTSSADPSGAPAPPGQNPPGQSPYDQGQPGQSHYGQAPSGQSQFGQTPPAGQYPPPGQPYPPTGPDYQAPGPPYPPPTQGYAYPPSGPGWGAPAGPPYATGPGWGVGPPGPPRAPKPGVVPLRPLGFGEVLDGAFTTVQRYPKIMLGMSALVMGALMVVSLVAMFVGLSDLLNVTTERELLEIGDRTWIAAGVSYLVIVVVAIVCTAALTGMITVTVGRGVLGQPATVGEVWQTAKGKIGRLIRLALLQGVVIGLGLTLAIAVIALVSVGLYQLQEVVGVLVGILLGLLTVVGLVILWVRLAIAPAALVLETRPAGPGSHPGSEQRPLGVIESLRRSWQLVRGRTWRTFGLLFVANLIGGVVSSILQTGFMFLGGAIGAGLQAATDSGFLAGGASIVFIGVGYVASMVLQLAFLSAIYVLVYVDARMRSEGLDLELAYVTSGDPAAATGTPWAAR